MRSIRAFLTISCTLAATLAVSVCAAQAVGRQAQKGIEKLPLTVTEISSPFALHAPSPSRVESIAFLAEDSMTAPDRQAVSDAMPFIQKNAALTGFDLDSDLDKGKWTYRQIVCPVLPTHILLLFSRNNGVGDVSKFSAVLSPEGKTAVRILPILRRSYALHPPAPVNPLTIFTFNWVRAQEHPDKKVDWLTTGLCYAGLTGTGVVLPRSAANHTKADAPLAMSPLLQVGADGSAVVRFVDVEVPQQPKEWDLTFNSNGKLLRAAVTPVPALEIKPLP